MYDVFAGELEKVAKTRIADLAKKVSGAGASLGQAGAMAPARRGALPVLPLPKKKPVSTETWDKQFLRRADERRELRSLVTHPKATRLKTDMPPHMAGAVVDNPDLAYLFKTSSAWTVEKIHKLAESVGLKWDDDPAFMQLSKRVTGKERLDDMSPTELRLLAAVLTIRGKRIAARRKQEPPRAAR